MGTNAEIQFGIQRCERANQMALPILYKDRDSFEDCLRENDVIPDRNERDRFKKCLQDRPYSKLILKC